MNRLSLALFVALLLSMANAWPGEGVDIQLRWHHQFQFAGYYAAVEKGYYAAEGLEVRLHAGDPAHQPIPEVLAGRAQYAVGNSEVLYQRLLGKPLVALAAIFQHSPSVLLVRRDSGINSVHDLVGKKVMLMNVAEEADFLSMFRNEGVSLSHLQALPSSYDLNDLVTGKVDAFNSYTTNEPYFLQQRGIPYTVIDPASYRIDFYSDVFFTTEAELRDHSQRVEAMRRATLKGWHYAMDHPEEIIDLLVTKYQVDKTRAHLEFEAAEMRKLIFPDLIEIGHMNPERWAHMADTFVRTGLVQPGYSLEGFLYDPSPRKLPAWLKPALIALLALLAATASVSLYLQRMNRRLLEAQAQATESERRLREMTTATRLHLEDLVGQRTAALEAANRQLIETRNAMDRLGIGIQWVDVDSGRFLDVSQAAAEMIGYSIEELLQRGVPAVSDVSPETFRGYAAELRLHGRLHLEANFKAKDGRVIPAEVTVYHQPGDGESGEHFIAFVTEISQRKEAERLLLKAKQDAEAANAAKSAFLANMSHEIRTPLHAITGMTHLIRRSGISPEQAGRLDRIEHAGRHLLEIINDFLDLSKIEAGKLVLNPTALDAGELVRDVAALVADEAAAKGLVIVIEDCDLPVRLMGDAARLRQALLNYAGNAVKFSEHGRITFRTAIQESGRYGALVRFEVSDTGIGIAPDALPRLFTAFEQADNSTTRKYGGTGLGLAITRRLAQLMDGEAGVTSTLGEGSTFWFTVRLATIDKRPDSRDPIRVRSAAEALKDKYRHLRVLVADDDPDNRYITRCLLEPVWPDVHLATDGLEAVEQATANVYDVILMDMRMPRMDGLEATRLIRGLPTGKDAIILAFSANVFPENRTECIEAGMNDLVPKAGQAEAPFEAILHWLEVKSSPITS